MAEDVEHVTNVCISDVYMFMGRELDALDEVPVGDMVFMGRELDALDEVPAGNILGVLRLVT